MKIAKTYSAKPTEVTRQWYLIDAASASLGRVATLAATYLMGKHKPTYTSHIDTGDGIVIINADKLKLTGKKMTDKIYYRHSGYIGNLKSLTAGQMLAKDSRKVVQHAIKGMIPRNRLQDARLARLKIYKDDKHEQEAQQPKTLEVTSGN